MQIVTQRKLIKFQSFQSHWEKKVFFNKEDAKRYSKTWAKKKLHNRLQQGAHFADLILFNTPVYIFTKVFQLSLIKPF